MCAEKKLGLFSNATDSFLCALCRCVRPALYLRGEYVIHESDIGRELFLIYRDSVDLISPDDSTVYSTLTEGNAFGEISLIYKIPQCVLR